MSVPEPIPVARAWNSLIGLCPVTCFTSEPVMESCPPRGPKWEPRICNRKSEAVAKKDGMDSGKPKYKLQDGACPGDKARPGNQNIPSRLVLPPSPTGIWEAVEEQASQLWLRPTVGFV